MATDNETDKSRACAPDFLAFGGAYAFFLREAQDYWVDAFQRTVLFLDLLRKRGNAFGVMDASQAPTVMHFKTEVVVDGRDLSFPVNYLLLRVLQEKGGADDPLKRPLVVFDPRAGQGPGIGGMKEDSEVGIALANGHPVYFVSFLLRPVQKQTVLAVCEAQARFIEAVIARHPRAPAPCLIGNCQAGWQIALTRALRPDLPGVLFLAAAPLSYWAGRRGGPIARYAGGMTGGTWLSSFLSDCGAGLFDGAWLVLGFEANNPARAYWRKMHDAYAKVDTEAERFLQFERWWGSPVLLGKEEMRFITKELFMENGFVRKEIYGRSGVKADLSAIKSPIVVFCSRGDDITPPAQALAWILDVYKDDEGLARAGRTIVYCMHESVGHLGIFVSSRVLAREYSKFIGALDMIEALPPGLYEAVFLMEGDDSVIRFERRSLDVLKVFGTVAPKDVDKFKTVARMSDIAERAYEAFVGPAVRSLCDKESAERLRAFHPVRVPFTFFSDKNPFLFAVEPYAAWAREERKPAASDNVFWRVQEEISGNVVVMLERLNQSKNALIEASFHSFYGAPVIQAAYGVEGAFSRPKEASYVKDDDALFLDEAENGGLPEAAIRALLYALRGSSFVDERAYEAFADLRKKGAFLPSFSASVCARVMRRQQRLLAQSEPCAIAALPLLLGEVDAEEKRNILDAIRLIVSADGPLSEEEKLRLQRLEALFFETTLVEKGK